MRRGARLLTTLGAALALSLLGAAGAGAAPVRVGVIDSGIGAADVSGHGSAVAAVLGGAAGGARIRLVSYPDVNRAGFAQPQLMAAAIRRAAADRMRVVNVSQTIAGRAPRVRRAIASAPRTLFVVAAGNEGLDLDLPGTERDPCTVPAPNVLCVAALDRGGQLAPFSNYGSETVDVAAPGRQGTSFAAPRVSARAAEIIWAHPRWPLRRVRAATVAS